MLSPSSRSQILHQRKSISIGCGREWNWKYLRSHHFVVKSHIPVHSSGCWCWEIGFQAWGHWHWGIPTLLGYRWQIHRKWYVRSSRAPWLYYFSPIFLSFFSWFLEKSCRMPSCFTSKKTYIFTYETYIQWLCLWYYKNMSYLFTRNVP